MIVKLSKISKNNKRQLRRFCSEVEHLCLQQQMKVTTQSKQSNCEAYIKELIARLKQKGKSSNQNAVNHASQSETSNTNDINSNFVK